MKSALLLSRMVVRQMVRRPVRTLLGLFGLAVSVCLVVWIVRGYEAAATGGGVPPDRSAGRFDVAITPPMPRMGPRPSPGSERRRPPATTAPTYIGAKVIEQLRADPAVAEIVATIRTRVRVVDPAPVVQMGPFGGGSVVGTPDSQPPDPIGQGRWIRGDGNEAVISAGFAERYNLALGGDCTVGGMGSEVKLTVVGILAAQPGGGGGMFSPAGGDLFVPPAAAEAINGYSGQFNLVNLVLNDPESADSFAKAWTSRLADGTPPLAARSLRQAAGDPMAGRMLGMVKVQADNAKVLAFLAAGFVIFVTLSVSVRERLREYAMLRAIVLSRSQLVAMIALEALLLTALGWALGLALARGLLGVGNALAVHMKFFQAGAFANYPLSRACIVTSALCAVAGAVAASILPAWQAIRVKPADILGGGDAPAGRRFPRVLVAIGVLLVIVNPAVVLLANVEPFKSVIAKTYTMGFAPPLLSCACAIAGLALVTPLVVRLIDVWVGPGVARLLCLNPRFLRQQLSGNLWRNVGTTIALSAGLTLFVTVLVWGYSMLVPFTPDNSLPRMLVSVLPAGLPESAMDEVRRTDGIVADQCLPLAVEQPRLTDATLASKPFSSVDESQQHLLLMGIDPEQALGGDDPVLKLQFVQGNRKSAASKLIDGRYCLVPDHFATQTGLTVGDTFSVEVPNQPGVSLQYEIAGVIYVPGWHWFTKFSEIRRRSGRALAVVFADYRQVKTDYRLDRISFLWTNASLAVSGPDMEKRLAPLADKYAGVRIDIPGAGPTQVNKQYVKITERGDLIGRLNRRADDVIWALTKFPLLALAIASLAVFNAVWASVRARYWQFGVLRGVGLSRWQLFRLVISESLMIFLAAGVMSLGSGILLAWCGTHVCTYFFYFGGMTPPLVLPWVRLALGFGITFGLCLLAGLLPAWQAARKEPLGFIQAGRLAM